MNPDQAGQNVGPDLDPNCFTLIVFPNFFFEKLILKSQQTTNKSPVIWFQEKKEPELHSEIMHRNLKKTELMKELLKSASEIERKSGRGKLRVVIEKKKGVSHRAS